MTTVSSASAAVTEGAKVVTPRWTNNGRNGKLRVMCRYGGSIVSLPQTKSPRYVGGDTRIVAVPPSAETVFASLVNHLALTLGISYDFKVKYQLPDQELDSLISVETDEDVQIMMEEHGYLSCESSIPKTRIRLFIFPSKSQSNEGGASQGDPAQCKAAADIDWLGIGESKPTRDELAQPVLQHPKTDTWFIDALKSAEMMQTGRNNSGSSGGSGDGNGAICGQESMMLETNSSFGSTSSSVSSSNLPPMKSTGEEKTLNSQVKFAPIESSDNTAVTPISSQELPISPHVLETKLSPNLYEAEVNKPVPIPVSGYPPFLNQAQQQHIPVVYTGQPYIIGNSPMTLPAATYHNTNYIHYQLPPQPYPIYYIPAEQYSSRHVQAPPVRHSTVLNTHQVVSPVVCTSSPLAPELSSQVYPPPKPVDSSVQTSSEAALNDLTSRDDFLYNTDLDDDTARAQIYKSQPPAPIVSSQFQTMMLTEALEKATETSETLNSRDDANFLAISWAMESLSYMRVGRIIFAGDAVDLFEAVSRPLAWPSFQFQAEEMRVLLRQFRDWRLVSEANRRATIIAQSVNKFCLMQSYVAASYPNWLQDLFVSESVLNSSS